MKTFNLLYKNIKQLQSFIIDNKINENPKILIQIFSNSDYTNFIETLLDNLTYILPQGNILGVSNTSLILDEENISETIISFTVFDYTIDKKPKMWSTPIIADNLVLYKRLYKASEEVYNVNKKLTQKVLDTTNKLLEQYYTDTLTNLYNSNKFNETIEDEKIHSLTLIDISSFVSINNFYGSKIGDSILIEFAKLLKVYSKKHHYTAYRIYSDIFAIIAKDNNEESDAFIGNMSLLQDKLHKHCFLHDKYKIFINTTFALSTNHYSAFRLTSMSLEYAKTNNISFIIYNQELNIEKKIQNNLIWVRKIINAIKSDRIIPYFQPICNNATGKYDKFEVLMRMVDENGEIVPPNKFLNIAKKAKLYKRLTKIIIDKSFETFENTDYDFSINLSVEDIINGETRNYIYEKLKSSSCSSHVIFELVESESIENFSQVVDFIDTIKLYGAKVAIDDFGTGFSNFHYLFKLNINCIKLDGSIIENIAKDKACELVAETIIGFAQKMNITTIAEYVSDEKIYDKIKQLGIDFSQGYYFSKPVENISNILA